MIQVCQNKKLNFKYCEGEFEVTPDDFIFYKKMKVPSPTFCPTCRLVRRMNNSNERTLYYRKCDLTGKNILSMFPENTPFPVYETDAWYSDSWDPYTYAMEYDFNRPFFEQFLELQNRVPRMALVKQGNSVNSPYTHRVNDMKDSYMVFRMTKSVESLYCYVGKNIINCIDCTSIWDCELCYECIDCNNSYKLLFSQESHSCRDSLFLYSCRNCSNCVGCINLVNGSYCIFNKQYTKEEYEKKLQELNLHTFSGIEKFKKEFTEFKKKFPFRSNHSLKSTNYSGNWIVSSSNVHNSFGTLNVKDGKNLCWVFDSQDVHDFFQWGNTAELVYESENCGIQVSRLFSCSQCWMGAHDLQYCDSCPGAGNCFGCIGLKKGEYSILNKKYSKEEYEILVEKIKQHMIDMPYTDKLGRVYSYGERFPMEISPFAYNETAAQDFFPLEQKEVSGFGLIWKHRQKTKYDTTIDSFMLPETIQEVPDSIVNEIISCEEYDREYSPGAFKITEQELLLYRKLNVPLPHVSFPVRYVRRLSARPSLILKNRTCAKCHKEVETVYTEDQAPILYCESCYQQEVL